MTRIAILGGGPAGVGAAFRLRRERKADVVLFERGAALGGNAGSFGWNGHRLDFGSHRLHPSCAPEILSDIRGLLGEDLLDRPRRGRIRLLGKWVHFPLRPADLLLHLDKRFALGSLGDIARKALPRDAAGEESFASVLERSLGGTICRHFYFPYARKIWGREPAELSAIQARKRVSAGSFGKLFRKVLGQVPGFKKPGAGRFFYPRGGFGRISEALGEAALRAGADLRTGCAVTGIVPPADAAAPWKIEAERNGERSVTEAGHVWSTLPLPVIARLLRADVPADVRSAASAIGYRSMILVYLELGSARFTEFDAHYFPEAGITITRLSEPKNYGLAAEPADRTVLCAELPCAFGDGHWTASDEDLGRLVVADLARAGLPDPGTPLAVTTRRLPQAYPLYTTGYERPLAVLDSFAASLPRFLTYGRQGLFAHDNTHHALAMAYAAVQGLEGGTFDSAAWSRHRAEFARHVVED